MLTGIQLPQTLSKSQINVMNYNVQTIGKLLPLFQFNAL
jgi:hypothetical protein